METVLTVINKHIKQCGPPPNLTTGGKYTAYFENEHGEQLVFQFDKVSKTGILWHGDYSWEYPLDVVNGIVSIIILSATELAWLKLVWDVAARPKEGV